MPVPAIRVPDSTAGAQLIEVFSSIQGEGTLLGRRQIFVRFAGCNLHCHYCDTPYAPREECRVEEIPGSGDFTTWKNPVQLKRILAYTRSLLETDSAGRHTHHSFALTGGEPLQQVEILCEWLPGLRELMPVQLETNGTLPHALARVLPWLDWVVMDIKLESQTMEPTAWEVHRDFLHLALQTRCCVKLVAGESTPDAELHAAGALMAEVALPYLANFDVVLQPRTINGGCSVSAQTLLRQQDILAGYGLDVRVIPQTHCFMNLL